MSEKPSASTGFATSEECEDPDWSEDETYDPSELSSGSTWSATIPGHLTDPVDGREYTLLRKLGSGRYGKVYYAKCTQEKEYAVKAMRLQDVKQNKLMEVDIHRHLKHPNIVELIRDIEDSSNLYLVLEFCPNKPIFRGIVAAVEYVHSRGIVHCDLKPYNVVMGKDMQAKLTDFGASVRICTAASNKMKCGTPSYMAPETLTAKGTQVATFAGDIWALGCILYRMVTGNLAFTYHKLRRKHAGGMYLRLGWLNFTLPCWLSSSARCVVRNCLHIDPTKRPLAEQLMEYEFVKKGQIRSAASVDALDTRCLASCSKDTTCTIRFSNNARVLTGVTVVRMNSGEGAWQAAGKQIIPGRGSMELRSSRF
ncbi:polo-like kinase 3 [Branchiostoma belcheri]|nr:polo-like kinase 3 [Branchiostoma belcheri]